MFKRILVPTDLSPLSLDAVDYAVDLAMPDKAEILIVFVIEQIQYSIPPLLIKRLRKEAAEKLARVAARVKQRYANCRTEVRFGVAYQVIVGLAPGEERADSDVHTWTNGPGSSPARERGRASC